MVRIQFKWILIFSTVILIGNLQAKILTLSDAENTAITTGYEARAKHFEEQAKEWEKKNTIAKYLPSVDYSMNFMRLGDKTIEETNKVFEGFGATFANMEIMKENVNILQTFHPESTYIPYFETGTTGDDEYANPMMQYKNSLKHEFTVSQPITNGGAEIFAIQIAKHTKNAIELEQKALRQEIIYNTRKAYFDALSSAERTKVARHDLSWTKNNLKKSEIKYKTGNTPVTDVLQWESDVAKKESGLLEAEALQMFLFYSLYQVMGFQKYNIQECQLQPFESFEQWYQKGIAPTNDGIEGNIQLQSIKYYTKAAEGYKKITMSSFLPKLNAFVSATLENVFNDEDRLSDINIEKKPPMLAVGAVMSVPLFSGFKNSTSFKKADYEFKKTLIEEQKVESQFKVNLERIRLFYKASFEAVKAAKKQQELMEKQLDIMQKRYDGGLVNQSQLLEVSLGSKMARIGYIQKLFECLLYEAEYLKNVGKLEVTQ